jgi:hypothetical protein
MYFEIIVIVIVGVDVAFAIASGKPMLQLEVLSLLMQTPPR